MGRPTKENVDYFPHDVDASTRDTLRIIEAKYSNDGYAVWFKVLEELGRNPGLALDCSDYRRLKLLAARANMDENRYTEILDELASLAAIDEQLWKNHKWIWSDNFVLRLQPVFAKRTTQPPQKPNPDQETGFQDPKPRKPTPKSTETAVSEPEMPQSRVEQSKGDNSREKKGSGEDVPDPLLEISNQFHIRQRETFPNESCWKDFDRTVLDGAKELNKLVRLDNWDQGEIIRVLSAVLQNDDWRPNVRSLRGIRVKGKNGLLKLENARAWIDQDASKGGGFLAIEHLIEEVIHEPQ